VLTTGFSHVEIKPRLWDLSWADASVPMRKGIVIANARRDERGCSIEVVLPAHMRADISLPLTCREIASILLNGEKVGRSAVR
jgi:hypothetical protein